MTPKKKILIKAGLLCLALCLCISFTACRSEETNEPTKAPETTTPGTAETATYQIVVRSEGGVALSNLDLYIYDSNGDLQHLIKTDADGKASFVGQVGEAYEAHLVKVPDGYLTEKSYAISGETTEIVLKIQMQEVDLTTASYKLGDVMGDFTFTDYTGKEYKLSSLMQEKKAVILMFWKDDNACKTQLAALEEAYSEIAEKVAVLAMNPTEQDGEKITAFAENMHVSFPIGSCEGSWETVMDIFGYPTTVVIDRFGMVTLVCDEPLDTAVKCKDIANFFSAEDYTLTVVEDYKTLLVSEPEDDVENPTEISGQSSFELTLKPGKVHYLSIHKVTNVWMQINHKDVFVEYGSKKFTASNGSVGLLVSAPSTFEPAQLGFGNSGEETITVTVSLSNLPGSYDNPYTMQIGEFTASVSAGNNQGVYYTYTAAEDGYLKLQCLSVSPSGVNYDFSVMNLTTSAMRNMSSEGETDEETGNPVVTMAMNKGEKVRIIISALPDDSNNYPAANFKMLSSFAAGDVEDYVEVEKIAYAVTVTDENRNPVPGVNIILTGTVPETPEGEEPAVADKISVSTDENGIASGYFPKDTYTGSLVIPAGYKATTVAFELSPDSPFASVKLDTHVIVMEDYSVRVIDEEGNPMAGVLITIGAIFGNTDEDGVFTATLEKGSYTAIIGVPEGYKADSMMVPFPENSNVLGITLKEAGSGDQSGFAYKVNVVNANGAGLTGILVTFNLYGDPVSMVPVDENGTAVAYLEPGNYTVTLTSSDGASLKFDSSTAVLSEEKPETTIMVAADISGAAHESAYWGNYFKLANGSSWVNLTKTLNYVEEYGAYMYVFYPAGSGIYRFSVTDGAVMGYYGTINFPNGPSLRSDNEEGYFEITVRDGEFANDNQPALLFGLLTESELREATMTIVRVADAPAELPVEVYEPTVEIEKFTLTQSGSISYVNLKGNANIEKRADGFYYLNGKKLYMNLSNSAPYLTMNVMLGYNYDGATGDWVASSMGTGMKGLIYDGDQVIAIADFTDCMTNYVKASDPNSGLYPLNDDLIHMVQTSGAYNGWWNVDSPNYLFSSVTGLNTDIAWMFAVCTVG